MCLDAELNNIAGGQIMQHTYDDRHLICWSKVCFFQDDWVGILVVGLITVLFMLPIVYYLF